MTPANLDLFSADAADPAALPADAPQPPTARLSLEDLLAEAGRKGALKAMAPELKQALEQAVAVVARAKRAAYERALAGAPAPAAGWLAREPALAEAIARLNAAFLDWTTIPMDGSRI